MTTVQLAVLIGDLTRELDGLRRELHALVRRIETLEGNQA